MKTIQICNVPDAVHQRLKQRAAAAGMSLSAYLLAEIRELAERPTLEELKERLASGSAVTLTISQAQVIRQLRGCD